MKRIKFVSIPVSNQDRALKFWTEQVGFQVATDRPFMPGQRWIELKIPGGQTGLVLFTPPGQEARIGQFQNISFDCDNVEKTYAEMVANGVEFVQGPKKESWGTSAIFKDPDGNTFVMGS